LTALKKDNRGFDLKQLLIGSEGTLGIVTAANLSLVPAIGERVVAWAGMQTIQQARQLLLHFEAEFPEQLEGFEVIPALCLDSVLAFMPSARSPLADRYEWNALVELAAPLGADFDLQESMESALARALEGGMISDAAIAANERQAEDFWQLREMIALGERAIGAGMQHDISVPVERMPDFVETAITKVEERFSETTALGFGHLGDGNIHFHVRAPQGVLVEQWEEQEGKEISRFVHDLVTQWGGSISAEHGIGQMKRDELARLGDPVALSIMRQVKQALDPKGLLNPGKLVPLAPVSTTA
ncbi:MAG: FAD-binding oxidoreductase, partial [Alphaproteobacteria bacterium]